MFVARKTTEVIRMTDKRGIRHDIVVERKRKDATILRLQRKYNFHMA
jgi:hypothetical protein